MFFTILPYMTKHHIWKYVIPQTNSLKLPFVFCEYLSNKRPRGLDSLNGHLLDRNKLVYAYNSDVAATRAG